MAYDADAHVAALRPPAFKAGGRWYRGRLLSVEEVLTISGLKASLDGQTEAESIAHSRAYTATIVTAWFPRRWWQLGHPALRAFRRLPDAVQVALLADFSVSQRNAMAQPRGTSGPEDDETTT